MCLHFCHILVLQVGSLQERIDELAEELEAARAAAAAAAAALAPAASTPATAADCTRTQPAAGTAGVDCNRRSSGGPGSPGTQLSRQSSSSKVPLMGDDTPLAELHAQVRLWPDSCAVLCSLCCGHQILLEPWLLQCHLCFVLLVRMLLLAADPHELARTGNAAHLPLHNRLLTCLPFLRCIASLADPHELARTGHAAHLPCSLCARPRL
jgi:hypothetical protein